MNKIFDAHVHIFPEEISDKACSNLSNFYSFDVNCRGTYSDFIKQAKNSNYGGFLAFSVATSAKQVENINSFIALQISNAQKDGFEAIGFAAMHQEYEDFEKEINRAEKLNLKGVKIHPDLQRVDINDKRFFPLYEILSYKNMSITFHMGDDRQEYQYSSADKLIDVMNNFPDLKVIASHLGGYKVYDESSSLLAGKKNIMFDTSSSFWILNEKKSLEIINRLGTENLMFGTDYPILPLDEEVHRFQKLPLHENELENILWNNAKCYFNLKG